MWNDKKIWKKSKLKVKRYEQYGRKASWIVKRYEKYMNEK